MMTAGTDPANRYHLPIFCRRECLDHRGIARADRPGCGCLLFHKKIEFAFLIKSALDAGEKFLGIDRFDQVTVSFGHDGMPDGLIVAVRGQENNWRSI